LRQGSKRSAGFLRIERPVQRGLFAGLLGICSLLLFNACGAGGTLDLSIPQATANPLVAKMVTSVPAGARAHVEFSPDFSYSLRTSDVAAPSGGGTVTILVAGMQQKTLYHMRVVVTESNGTVQTGEDEVFQTGAVDMATLGMPSFTTTGDTGAGRGVELLNIYSAKTVQVVATDMGGNVIWYYAHPLTESAIFPVKPLANGDMLVGLEGALREITLDGTTVRQLLVPDLNTMLTAAGADFQALYLHHDFALLPNGHVVLIVAIKKDFTNLPGYPGTTTVTGDALVDLDPTWKPVWYWNTFNHLDVNRHPLISPQGFPDWTHSNALLYDSSDHNLILSMRNQSWIIKIDYRDGSGTKNVIWHLGNQGDFAISSGDPADWFYGQHYPWIVSTTGNVLHLSVFDDGNQRILDSAGDYCGETGQPACYSRAVIYDVDQTNMTTNVAWSDLPGMYTFWGGVNWVLPDNNVEFELSAPVGFPGSQVFEVTQTAAPTVVWQMGVSVPLVYRAVRIPSLYPGVTW
jgi:arylsulfate sulfotransferase